MNLRFHYVMLLFLFVSCKKEDERKGTATAQKDGAPWSATVYAQRSETDPGRFHLGLLGYADDIKEVADLDDIPIALGRYRVFRWVWPAVDPPRVIGLYSTSTDDVLCDLYENAEEDSSSNYIRVENYDAATNKVSGSFELKFSIQPPKCRSTALDTVIFRNGRFEAFLE